MTVTGPRIKDFTGVADARFPVEIVSDPLFEALLSLFILTTHRDGTLSQTDVDPSWFERVESAGGPSLTSGLERLSGVPQVWLGLIGPALALGDHRSAEALAEIVRADADATRRRLADAVCEHCSTPEERDLVAAAVAGDAAAMARVAAGDGCPTPEPLKKLLSRPAAEIADLIADTLLTFAHDVFGDGEDVAPVLKHDAEHKQAMAMTMEPSQLVEVATNGVTFTMIPEVDRIVLIPSVILRPWVTISDHGRTRVFCYSVAEEHLEADADTPPAWLVEVYKALGDERRLRILRILKDGPASLADITTRTSLAKSTVHHHLSVLRRAGLVRITLGTESEYSLRGDAVPEAARLLAGFLDQD
jgi:DNA-binding transcriptional ArsR family regulator